MQQGNKQLLACANVTQMAGLLDNIDIKVNYHKMHTKEWQNIMNWSQKYIRNIEVDQSKHSNLKQGEINSKVRFSPDLQQVNVSIVSKEGKLRLMNTEVNEWAQRIFVIHPAFSVKDRLEGKLYGEKTYKRMLSFLSCSILYIKNINEITY